jgi:hypothetical protein
LRGLGLIGAFILVWINEMSSVFILGKLLGWTETGGDAPAGRTTERRSSAGDNNSGEFDKFEVVVAAEAVPYGLP